MAAKFRVITRIDHMPPGTIGFRAAGTLEPADYLEVLQPGLTAALATGGLRLLFDLDDDLDHVTAGAMLADVRNGLDLEFGEGDWERAAIVTDLEWVRGALKVFAWMVPGKLGVFAREDYDAAKEWVASRN